MDTTYEIQNRILIIHLSKELDHHSAAGVRYTADGLIEQGQSDSIVFDFKDTVFMDSSGIGVIMGRYKKVKERGGFVGVVGVGPCIHRILEISGMYKLVENLDGKQEESYAN